MSLTASQQMVFSGFYVQLLPKWKERADAYEALASSIYGETGIMPQQPWSGRESSKATWAAVQAMAEAALMMGASFGARSAFSTYDPSGLFNAGIYDYLDDGTSP